MTNLPPRKDGRRGQESKDPEDPQQKLHVMLASLWERSRKAVAERVNILRDAKLLAEKNMLNEGARMRAVDAAHKLAGVLGTFGLPRGTDLAREVEETFSARSKFGALELSRLDSILNELEVLIRTKNPVN
jgi:HPt (histidine-containing phosphotransfer) domain-containing protein